MSFKHEKRRNDTELGCNKDVFNSGLFVKLGTTAYHWELLDRFILVVFLPTAMVKTPLVSEKSYNISNQRSKVIWKISNFF